jgi:hypothetical protein
MSEVLLSAVLLRRALLSEHKGHNWLLNQSAKTVLCLQVKDGGTFF